MSLPNRLALTVSAALFLAGGVADCSDATVPASSVAIRVDARITQGELTPIWRFFGADEPNYAYMKDGSKLLGELGELRRGEVFFRPHNMLTSGDGTPALKWGFTGAYREDAAGRAIY